jgi:hypothetical protein
MTSLEGRGHCAGRRAMSHLGPPVADPGCLAFAVRNGPLMAQAWLPDVAKRRQRNEYAGAAADQSGRRVPIDLKVLRSGPVQ